MAAGGRRRRPPRYQSLAALVEDSQWPFLFLVSDFSYGAEDYDAEGHEEQKGPPEGSETMPYIDESPTMSPQLSARSQGGGDSISPTPPEGLASGVGIPVFSSGEGKQNRIWRKWARVYLGQCWQWGWGRWAWAADALWSSSTTCCPLLPSTCFPARPASWTLSPPPSSAISQAQ